MLASTAARSAPCVRAPSCVSKAVRSSKLTSRRVSALRVAVPRPVSRRVQASASKEQEPKSNATDDVEKYGLEAGLFKVMTDKNADNASKAADAKSLLKRYGSAYLVTSISFAAVSYAICYALVSQGVDVPALLAKVGITTSATSEKVGTAAIAYAAHKAASPIRFPPTVALTPVVAKWLGKESADEEE